MTASVDKQTLALYDAQAAKYAKDWKNQPEPKHIQDILQKHFVPGGFTADVGCGSGREVDWLNRHDFRATGFDASQGLLRMARGLYPFWKFESAVLPELSEIPSASFDNVLCQTVIMHLPFESVEPSIRSLLRILRPGGVIHLSWRMPDDRASPRNPDGRLYTSIEFRDVRPILEGAGAEILIHDEIISPSSGKPIRQLTARLA